MNNRRSNSQNFKTIAHQLDTIQHSLSESKGDLNQVSKLVTKLIEDTQGVGNLYNSLFVSYQIGNDFLELQKKINAIKDYVDAHQRSNKTISSHQGLINDFSGQVELLISGHAVEIVEKIKALISEEGLKQTGDMGLPEGLEDGALFQQWIGSMRESTQKIAAARLKIEEGKKSFADHYAQLN